MEETRDLILIRHAQSKNKYNLPYGWIELSSHQHFQEYLKHVKHNYDLIDCDLTQKGHKQCLQALETTKNLKYDLIIVSPLNRALKTCSNLFPNCKTPIIVEPILSEALRSACDISDNLSEKMKQYPHYNFDKVLEKGEFWFIENNSQKNQQILSQYFKKHNAKTLEEKKKAILKLMDETNFYEQPINVRMRVKKIKKMLEEYRKKYNKIIVVSHYNIINYLECNKYDANHEPQNLLKIRNCQIYETSLDKILKYQ